MDPILIVIAVIAIGAIVFFVAKGRGNKVLPPEDTSPALPRDEQPATPAARPSPSADTATADAPKDSGASSESKSPEARAAAPVATPSAGEPAATTEASRPEDIIPEAPSAAAIRLPERRVTSSSDAPSTAAATAPIASEPPRASTRPSKRPPSPEENVAALKKGLKATRGGFISRLAQLFGGKKEIDPALLDELEEVLITADIGVHTADKILSNLRERLANNDLADTDKVWDALRTHASEILDSAERPFSLDQQPTVILVVGVNGVGKTTTIGKLASRLQAEGRSVMLAAGDTYRAAAVLQLEVWGRRVGCPVVKGKDRADPGSVIFDAIQKAKDEGVDVLLADTAGRLHTKAPLMEELAKVGRTAEKALGRPADEILLVLDSTNGQNAIQQAQLFKEALPVSGIVLTKLDGTAKGGVILGIVDQHKVPVRFVGIGERVEDLRVFDTPEFVQALFEKPEA